MKKQKNYINKKDFLEALSNYKKVCEEAESKKQEAPQVPNYIGECFLKIAQGVAKNWRFSRYTYREEMISDGILICLLYFRNFDPEHIKANPFGYFSQYIFNACKLRIKKEKKEQYVKYMSLVHSGVLEELDGGDLDENHPKQFELYENIAEFIETYETGLKKEKDKKKVSMEMKGIEKFMD
jgi:hypothetical protein